MQDELLRILFIGDIVGKPGRCALKNYLPILKRKFIPHLTIANCENAAGGFGFTEKVMREMKTAGVEVFTSGNHIWDKKEIFRWIDRVENVLRPANYPDGVPGKGWGVFDTSAGKVGVLNISGRVFMEPLDCPFRTADRIVERIKRETSVIIVDIHAEATSEKMAIGFYLNGKVSAVVGTHTHVQTSDERILDGGTGYITDVGMVGDVDGIIGMSKSIALERFLLHIPKKFEVAKGSDLELQGVFLRINKEGKCVEIERIKEKVYQC